MPSLTPSSQHQWLIARAHQPYTMHTIYKVTHCIHWVNDVNRRNITRAIYHQEDNQASIFICGNHVGTNRIIINNKHTVSHMLLSRQNDKSRQPTLRLEFNPGYPVCSTIYMYIYADIFIFITVFENLCMWSRRIIQTSDERTCESLFVQRRG